MGNNEKLEFLFVLLKYYILISLVVCCIKVPFYALMQQSINKSNGKKKKLYMMSRKIPMKEDAKMLLLDHL